MVAAESNVDEREGLRGFNAMIEEAIRLHVGDVRPEVMINVFADAIKNRSLYLQEKQLEELTDCGDTDTRSH